MSKLVSNDALWEKLSEIEGTINRYLKEQKVPVPTQELTDIKSELSGNKDEIIGKLKKYIQGLGTHCDSHFKTIHRHLEQLEKDTEGIYRVLACINAIQQESKKQQETKSEQDRYHFNFKFFKVRKSSLVIAVLGLLVFILTLFCMKQQNDYALLLNENYKQETLILKPHKELEKAKRKTIE
ncbi:hypothetical protein M2459_000399 [Parabacteroides sp. PF5-5]|uniref:hypothetical protein n=1 Tax=unclassified Parabacteroides TaxID=2649774 RepID=UPI0024734069|nr:MULTISPECIES: hypothetical protein [unclassified Parabacteroides]MDH6303667.1 hypothetical protein [Parabacteroides sp. PH5-39]MDH6314989.1 hypothetical protein [Parabacteroides sp. PF5-13]MDH6318326.1 hypothetical protein [Parabacteroides sp. PH5-13]MDH6321742.1 hypothetical protein [Parabacteroides sp. PH5-8]MDH6325865.1 hypothetical protein [Parabacteroides sp. PH5-41]